MVEEIEFKTSNIKKKVARLTFTIRLDDDLLAQLKAYWETNKLSKSKAIRKLIADGVKVV